MNWTLLLFLQIFSSENISMMRIILYERHNLLKKEFVPILDLRLGLDLALKFSSTSKRCYKFHYY